MSTRIQCNRCGEWFTPKGIIVNESDNAFYCIGCFIWIQESVNDIFENYLNQEVERIFESENK